LRDRPVAITEADLPNKDISLSEDFIRKQEHVVMWLGNALARVMQAGRSVDGDAREGLESLIKTYRTLESGLIYESRPSNPYAADIQEALKQAIDELRKQIPKPISTLVMKERPADFPRPTFRHHRGEFLQTEERVTPGVLSILNPVARLLACVDRACCGGSQQALKGGAFHVTRCATCDGVP